MDLKGTGKGSEPTRRGDAEKVWRIGDVTVDIENGKVFRGGAAVSLTRKEYALLEALLLRRGRTITREELFSIVWGYDYIGNTRTVDVHVKQLRRKLGLYDAIRTVFKRGYRFDGGETGIEKDPTQ